MAIKLVSRAAWGARSARSTATYLASTRGVKVHYTGDSMDPRIAADHGRCAARVRAIQNGHMDGNGWADIGYSMVVCAHGHVFVGRGAHRLPAANGPGLNTGHYAVCGLVGNKGTTQPTDAMLHGIRDAIEYLRSRGGAGGEIKGHRDGYATDCPGGPLYAWVRKGAPRPAAEPEKEEEETMKTVVDLGMRQPVTVPAGARASIPFEIEWQDPGKIHPDASGGVRHPSVLIKGADAPYAVSVEVILTERPGPGVEVTVASYGRSTDDFERDIRGKELATARDVLHSNVRMSDKHKYRVDLVNNSGVDVTVREAYMLIAH
ncbi:peptidoglycan recognition protein family protein [Actinomadura craniellae]|uniref:peptidoglycan recognition protein family protein n=1 Tax=Actinomadura craniellae TaxID=2231787 RepID=UPI0018F143D1|nr:peptidoglycan recognition family protein [Actinomadura craniellae]